MYPLDLSPGASYVGLPTTHIHRSEYNYSETNIPKLRVRDVHRTSLLSKREKDQGKRGRPRADILTTLMIEGSSSRSKIRCEKCGRAFPREKSLQAHLRTHTGERPYCCDFPDCKKSFCQSGQLRTHQRLHTGERPFVCAEHGCTTRFTHSNRHCSQHINAGLIRLEVDLAQVAKRYEEETNEEVRKWISKYILQYQDRGSPKSPHKIKRSFFSGTQQNHPSSVRKSVSPPMLVPAGIGRSLSLPRIPSPNSLTASGSRSSNTPLLKATSLQATTPDSKTILTPAETPRQCSASSVGSSSSGVSSMASLPSSASSTPTHHSTPPPDTQHYIFSSQMVLQGHDSDISQHAYTSSLHQSPTEEIRADTCTNISADFILNEERDSQSSVMTSHSYQKTDSINSTHYRTTPKNREKDRYISALALIELSQG